MFRTLGLAILPAVCLFAASFSVRADSCNPALLSWRDPGVAFPYSKQADGRCEGRYAKDDAGQGRILVASLVAARFDFDPKATASISLAWSAPKGKTIHLTACSLIRQVHYQMDVERPGDPGQYSWPMDVLSKTSLKSSDIGIVAFYQENIAGKAQPIYLPVSVNEFSPSTRASFATRFCPADRIVESVSFH
jgi:hypothetical protein